MGKRTAHWPGGPARLMGVSLGFSKGPQHPFGTFLAKSGMTHLSSSLMRKRGCERLRQACSVAGKDARMGMALAGFCPRAGLSEKRTSGCAVLLLPQQRFSYKPRGREMIGVVLARSCFAGVPGLALPVHKVFFIGTATSSVQLIMVDADRLQRLPFNRCFSSTQT